jgi:sRNA-binding regulator protein Hfq
MTLQGLGTVTGLVLVIGSSGALMTASAAQETTAVYRGVGFAERFDVSPPLAELAQRAPFFESFTNPDIKDRPTGLEGPFGPQDIDPLVQQNVGPGEIPAPSVGFDAFTGTVSPPDPNGAVGPNHFVVIANVQFAVYSRTGALIVGPSNINTLWSGFGGACQNENAGDPVVLYDRQADRWLITQFTAAGPTFFNCVALSQTGNPAGAYYRWAFGTGGNFPDYPKYGIWPDAYYISTREFLGSAGPFQGVGAYALNRAQMIAGNPNPQVISFLVPPGGTPYRVGDGLLPSDLDGSTPPPTGSPNFYIGTQDNGGPYGAPSDAVNIFRFHVDFAIPANSTFTGPIVVPATAFDTIFPCAPGSRDCIPQPGTAQKLDHLGYRQRPLFRAAYRNFGTHEAIVTNQSVEASGGLSGIRWWEIRNPNGSPTIFQEGTYAPADGVHRWMGSIAQDKQGNMALGYSVSNATSVFPGIRYTGRLVGDPLGTMPQGEGVFANGAGSQTGSPRWGDYTAVTLDPTDDCTFWYVNEYFQATGPTWRLRVGAFKYPSCTPPPAPPAPPPPVLACTLASYFGDFNGDGRSDLLFRRESDGMLSQYLMNGFQFTSVQLLGAVGLDRTLAAVADFNGDGTADLLFRRDSDGLLSLYLYSGSQLLGAQLLGTIGLEWELVGAADFNGDGRADMVFRRKSDGMLSLYLMNGFQILQAQLLGSVGLDWRVRAVADFNGDGRADILFRRNSDGMLSLYLFNGFQLLGAQLLGAIGLDWNLLGARDFNGDGRADILFRRSSDGMLSLYLMNGFQILQAQLIGAIGLDRTLLGLGDFNGDGRSDMLFRRTSDGQLSMYLMNGFQLIGAQVIGTIGKEWGACYGQPPLAIASRASNH